MMNELDRACVITADIIGSRVMPNRSEVQKEFTALLDKINSIFKDDLLAPFIITLGDECQGVLKSPYNVYNVVLSFHKLSSISFHIGIGLGSIDTDLSRKATDMDGSVFSRSRDAILLVKKETREGNTRAVFISGDESFDTMMNTLFELSLNTRNDWTDRQRQIVSYLEENPSLTYAKIGEKFSITKQTVHSILKASNWPILKKIEQIVFMLQTMDSARVNKRFGKSENITLAACKRILRESGARRVSEDAARRLMESLEHAGTKIAKQALSHAQERKKATVDEEDIEYGISRLDKELVI